MRALVCEEVGSVTLREVPEPTPLPGEVIVRMEAALTCGTDLKMIRRGHPKVPFPVVLGHELAGVVHRVGEGTHFGPGERVVPVVTGPCGGCEACQAGRENLCPTAFDRPLWGAFADLVRVPERVVRRGLRRLPEGVSFKAAALLDPLASVVRGLSRVPLPPGATVLLYGCGPIALLFAVLARRAGVTRLLAVGRRPSRLAALRAQGAEVFDRSAMNVRAAVRQATGGRGADAVVDTTGDASTVSDLVELAARGGTVLLFAGMPRDARIEVEAARIHYDEVSLAGSFHYTPADADEALGLLHAGAIPIDDVVTATRPLADYADVLARAMRGEGMKTAFVP